MIEINIGDRFGTRLPTTWAEFEARNRTHGWQDFAIHIEGEETLSRLAVVDAARAALTPAKT